MVRLLSKRDRAGEVEEETSTNLADIGVIEVGPAVFTVSPAACDTAGIVEIGNTCAVVLSDAGDEVFDDLNCFYTALQNDLVEVVPGSSVLRDGPLSLVDGVLLSVQLESSGWCATDH